MNAGGTDAGTSPTNAWTRLIASTKSIVYNGYSPGDANWIRRDNGASRTIDTASGAMYFSDRGSATSPLLMVGWPRAAVSLSQADWTRGSQVVDNVVGVTLAASDHIARNIVGPDGRTYMVSEVVDSNTMKVLQPYVGSTVTGASGACSISADDFYSGRPAAGQSAGWDSDGQNIPQVDFNGGHNIAGSLDYYWWFEGLEFYNCSSGYGAISLARCGLFLFRGCYFNSMRTAVVVGMGSTAIFDRCVFTGLGGGSLHSYNLAVTTRGGAGVALFKNCAVYGFGDDPFGDSYYSRGNFFFQDCNIGVEEANYHGLTSEAQQMHLGMNVKVGSPTSGSAWRNLSSTDQGLNPFFPSGCSFENYGRSLNVKEAHRGLGTVILKDVVAGSGDPEKRTGGSDFVLDIFFDATGVGTQPCHDFTPIVLEGFIKQAEDTTETYEISIQANGAVTSAQLWLEAYFLSDYYDDDTYLFSIVESDENVSTRTGADDWGNTLQVEITTPAGCGDSPVRFRLCCNYYHASNHIYADPLIETV